MVTLSPGGYRYTPEYQPGRGSQSRIAFLLFEAHRNNSGCMHACGILLHAQASGPLLPCFWIPALVAVPMHP